MCMVVRRYMIILWSGYNATQKHTRKWATTSPSRSYESVAGNSCLIVGAESCIYACLANLGCRAIKNISIVFIRMSVATEEEEEE